MTAPRIMIMGVGNVLLSDEGLGVHFLNELSKDPLPEQVELLEGGTAGLELVHLIQDVDYLIIIDAINAQTEPGAIFRFKPQEIRVFPEQYEVSFHQVGIMEVLTMADLLGRAPQTMIFGVQPKSLDWGLGVTAEIEAVYPPLKAMVLREVQSLIENGTFLENMPK